MAWSTVAFTEATGGAVSSLATVPLLTDQIFRSTGNGVVVDPTFNKLGMMYGVAITLTRAQFDSPTLRQLFNQEVRPIQVGFPSIADDVTLIDMMGNPIPLGANEELDYYITDGASEQAYGFCNLLDNPAKPVAGIPRTQLFTGSTTVTANAWSLCPLTADQALPPGSYQVIGARFESSTAVAFRLVFPGQVARPGGPGLRAAGLYDWPAMRNGGWGAWGTFIFNLPPSIEVICGSADTAQKVYLDMIYTASH
jgi:hypothetical protein